jgi:hypothetical protein
MRCEEVRDHFIEFVYDEGDDSPLKLEAREHLRTCSACQGELEELKRTQKYLQLWKDEDPLRNIVIAGQKANLHRRSNWKYPRYAAIAAMILLCFLALANTQVTWNRDGFSLRTRLFSGNELTQDYYTKSEVRDIMKRALDDSELQITETNYLMMQKMLDTVEQDQLMDLRLARGNRASNHNKN